MKLAIEEKEFRIIRPLIKIGHTNCLAFFHAIENCDSGSPTDQYVRARKPQRKRTSRRTGREPVHENIASDRLKIDLYSRDIAPRSAAECAAIGILFMLSKNVLNSRGIAIGILIVDEYLAACRPSKFATCPHLV
jgi:hypothetical protein